MLSYGLTLATMVLFDWLARILEVLSRARELVTRDLGSRVPV